MEAFAGVGLCTAAQTRAEGLHIHTVFFWHLRLSEVRKKKDGAGGCAILGRPSIEACCQQGIWARALFSPENLPWFSEPCPWVLWLWLNMSVRAMSGHGPWPW